MKKILLIEDQPAPGDKTAELLRLGSFSVLSAASAADGARIAKAESPDVVICDLTGPGTDFYDLVHALQKAATTRFIPVIVLTGDFEKAHLRRIMASGADDYLVKPFEGIELLRSVEACLLRQQRLASGLRRESPTSSIATAPTGNSSWHPENRDARPYKKKFILYSEGQRATQVWYIVDGKIKTYLTHSDGKELITGIHGAGECIGYSAAIRGGLHTDNAQVLEDADCIVFSRSEFLELLRSDTSLSRQIMGWLAHSAGEKDEGLVNLAYSSLRKKVANGIISLSTTFRQQCEGKIFIAISRDNLAAYVGSAPESLTRTLGDFRKEGLIDISDGRIWLLDEARLRKMVN